MEALLNAFGKVLSDMGLAGVVIAGLAGMVYLLYQANEAKQQTIVELVREQVKANETTTAALSRLSDILLNGRNAGA